MLALSCTVACSAARSEARASVAAPAMPARWVGPAKVPMIVEGDAASRDLAALYAVFSFWGRSATPAAADSVRAEPGEPLLAGDMERLARAAGLTALTFHGTMEEDRKSVV